MLKYFRVIIFFCLFLLEFYGLWSQDSTGSCKVLSGNLAGNYRGACKNGFANGKGEAIGIDRYTGSFKNGLPDGKGTYYFNDNFYYAGNFQDGIKEGKGELHYIRKYLPDSIINGYWSADEYRGKVYKTYNFSSSGTFDNIEIIPSEQGGNYISFEIVTTTGSPDGTAMTLTGKSKSGFVLTIADIYSTNNCVLTKIISNSTASKSLYTYSLSKFPANLYITLSNGRIIELDLYKAAKWKVRLFLNQ